MSQKGTAVSPDVLPFSGFTYLLCTSIIIKFSMQQAEGHFSVFWMDCVWTAFLFGVIQWSVKSWTVSIEAVNSQFEWKNLKLFQTSDQIYVFMFPTSANQR